MDVVTTIRSGRSEVRILPGAKNLFLIQSLKAHCGAQPHSIRCLFSRITRPESKAERSPSSSTEVKNEWNYTSTLLEDSVA